jgi:hypothetical protein
MLYVFSRFFSHLPPFSVPGNATQEWPRCGAPPAGGEQINDGFQGKEKRPKETKDKEASSQGKGKVAAMEKRGENDKESNRQNSNKNQENDL